MATPADAPASANAAAAKSAAPAVQIVQVVQVVQNDIGAKTAGAKSAFYGTEAELFHGRSRMSRRRPVGYKRFPRADAAIRYAIEDLPPELLLSSVLEVDEKRYDSREIRRLYASADYPLTRRAAA